MFQNFILFNNRKCLSETLMVVLRWVPFRVMPEVPVLAQTGRSGAKKTMDVIILTSIAKIQHGNLNEFYTVR
ncbi:hypothetical protein DYBT9275_00486 [Dyadobacter sp. CECT 9275]|uniref:Uncharacterized protein n=1 Tax=Dyadobacter helix TaxID=2822344 RepID=A0A916NJN4_9BACT|nr:hypothetical protein DYBT9275_00486 [Dyadobacter sp. CECT 9275]